MIMFDPLIVFIVVKDKAEVQKNPPIATRLQVV